MGALIGTTNQNSVAGAVKLRRVTVTPADGAAAYVDLFRYQDVNGDEVVRLKTIAGQSSQFDFDDVPFPDGLTVVPSADVVSYVVEYG